MYFRKGFFREDTKGFVFKKIIYRKECIHYLLDCFKKILINNTLIHIKCSEHISIINKKKIFFTKAKLPL